MRKIIVEVEVAEVGKDGYLIDPEVQARSYAQEIAYMLNQQFDTYRTTHLFIPKEVRL